MKLALIDDDAGSAGQLLRLLAGRACRHYQSGPHLLQQLQHDAAALLIVPAAMLNSGSAARSAALRDVLQRSGLPVLLIAARDDSTALPASLSIATFTDYLVAPVRRHALLLRIAVLLQRAYPQQALQQEEAFGPFVFRWPPATLTRAGEAVTLTQKEFDLALLLLRHSDRPLSRAFILETLWPDAGDEVSSRTLDTHISRVRTKLALQPRHGYRLSTVYGYGYRLEQVGAESAGAGPDRSAAV